MEVCVDNVDSLINAVQGGASRIELCSALSEGGLTPSFGFFKLAKSLTTIPIHVLIRSRTGDFNYNENDLKIMAEDSKVLVEAGADGIVFGCLDKTANIDVNGCKLILDAVKNSPINFTFHRAFDVVQDPIKAAQLIKELGFTRILTSGQVSELSKSYIS